MMYKDNEYIALNFSPLKQQEFEFTIYRKLKEETDKKDTFSFAVAERKLPPETDAATFVKYWVSFTPQENFTPYTCNQSINTLISTDYIFLMLTEQCTKTLQTNEYKIDKSFIGDRIKFIIKDEKEGEQVIWFEAYYLKTSKKFGFLFDFKFDQKKGQEFNKKVQELSLSIGSDGRSNKNIYADKYNQIKLFAQKFFYKIFKDTILDFSTNEELKVSFLNKKTYVFANNQDGYSQYDLTKKFPYEPINGKAKIYFFYRQGENNIILEFHEELKRLLTNYYKVDVDFKSYKTDNINQEIINNLITEINTLPENIKPLVIILLKNKDAENDIYYSCKYHFTLNNIPIQFAEYKVTKNRFSVGNVALQIFSKLSGKPWKVKPRNEKCLIIGLAQANQKEVIDNEVRIKKYFAYSVLLDASGIYKSLQVISEGNDEENYLKGLKNNLTNIIKEHKDEYNKIVIHTPFKVKKNELDQIDAAIKSFGEEMIDFVVIRINTQNKFYGYNKKLNSLTPYESSTIRISYDEYLIWFEGLQFHDNLPQKRYSAPTYVEFLYHNKEELTDKEKYDYLQDIINLSGANWRGFNAKSLPVSIYYCQIVSKFIKEFRQRNYSNIDFANFQPWFL